MEFHEKVRDILSEQHGKQLRMAKQQCSRESWSRLRSTICKNI
jgi:hypothetical protein